MYDIILQNIWLAILSLITGMCLGHVVPVFCDSFIYSPDRCSWLRQHETIYSEKHDVTNDKNITGVGFIMIMLTHNKYISISFHIWTEGRLQVLFSVDQNNSWTLLNIPLKLSSIMVVNRAFWRSFRLSPSTNHALPNTSYVETHTQHTTPLYFMPHDHICANVTHSSWFVCSFWYCCTDFNNRNYTQTRSTNSQPQRARRCWGKDNLRSGRRLVCSGTGAAEGRLTQTSGLGGHHARDEQGGDAEKQITTLLGLLRADCQEPLGWIVCSTSLMASLIRSIVGLSKCFSQCLWLDVLSADVIGQSINRCGVA